MSGGPVGAHEMIAQEGSDGSPQADHPGGDRDPEPSQATSAWLREAGLRVIGCLGPQPPS